MGDLSWKFVYPPATNAVHAENFPELVSTGLDLGEKRLAFIYLPDSELALRVPVLSMKLETDLWGDGDIPTRYANCFTWSVHGLIYSSIF